MTDEDRKWGLDRVVWDTDGTELARVGELLRTWGLDRVLWGIDGDAEYLNRTRELWPLREDEWEIVASNDGTAFLGPGPTPRR